jgi:hypothetical protein
LGPDVVNVFVENILNSFDEEVCACFFWGDDDEIVVFLSESIVSVRGSSSAVMSIVRSCFFMVGPDLLRDLL